ncbi:GNAT family N-acetyltransferase [Kitasatospora misakiensis]|uniref:GNAT family N-acetyltransferase n=1 Tax=Kitasatospora misakiensis TaxID=67330 RepID=A0ABW0X4M4_9ACTN
MTEAAETVVEVADPARWADVEALLGQRGSVKGCWCMFFRQTPQERRTEWGEGNRRALKGLVDAGAAPGLVAYRDGEPAGWCSVAPRAEYSRLDRSPVTKPVDDTEVWSLVCLFVDRRHRGAGVSRALVRAAVAHARAGGASVLEAYPVDESLGPVSADDAYHGLAGVLAAEGFAEVARRTAKRPVMRLALTP